ncbi:MAG: transporter substrate-binding domain-containing protein [Treponema sp.]|nr:transporter substrate-binding domain-containing protein [Treponema sp.]
MKKITKIAGLLLAVSLMGSAFASGKKDGSKENVIGVLSYLNYTEKQLASIYEGSSLARKQLEEKGYFKSVQGNKIDEQSPVSSVKFYDTLDSLLLALKSGEITCVAGLPQTTAKYLCANDKNLEVTATFDFSKKREKSSFADAAFNRLADGFTFMMMESNKSLCDDFNKIITEMQNDGSMKKLVQEQIIATMNGQELKADNSEYKEGRGTIRVAVTGSLPPMDYVAADGSFAGFNTALLAEIGKRLNKNISMVQVSSVGRATALASGVVDVVFWTRSTAPSPVAAVGKSEFLNRRAGSNAKFTAEEIAAMNALTKAITGDMQGDARSITLHRDMPENTIITIPYFTDMPVSVQLKK